MKSKIRKIVFHFITYFAAFALGGAAVYYSSEPASIVWGFFLGNEIHSKASFPRRHMARIYSAWGFGEQQFIFVVDGNRVYRTPDFVSGNVDEKIVWNESGEVVTFIAAGGKIFTYDTRSGVGSKE